MHSHLIPGVDDGAESIETSLSLIQGLLSLGYKRIITTPHIRPDYFPNTREDLLERFADLKAAVKAAGIEVELACAAEYFVDYDFEATLEDNDLLKFSGNHVLIEISTFSPPPNLHETLFKLRIKGYQPILAHPERYVFFTKMEDFQKLKDFGCLFQLNILSLTGHYGKAVKDLANQLLKKDMIDLLGTDCHHQRHIDSLQKVTTDRTIMAIVQGKQFQNAAF